MTERVHHVWVRPEHTPTEMPGLVLEWRRNSEGEWEARVTFVEPRGGWSRIGCRRNSCDRSCSRDRFCRTVPMGGLTQVQCDAGAPAGWYLHPCAVDGEHSKLLEQAGE